MVMITKTAIYIYFIFFLTSCSVNNFNNCFFTNNHCFYINKELNFFHKTEKNNLLNVEKNHLEVIKIKKNKTTLEVIHLIDTIGYFNNFNSNVEYFDIKKTGGISNDYINDEFKYVNYSYIFKDQKYNQTVIYTNDAILCLKSNGDLQSNLEWAKNSILDAHKFATNSKSFFNNRFFEFNEFLVIDVFNKYNNVEDLSIDNNFLTTYLINYYNQQGNYKLANQLVNKFNSNKSILWKDNFNVKDFEIENIEKFCNSIKESDIVLLNDHHLFESSRYSCSLFLSELKKYGFNYFAAEDFALNDNELLFNIDQNDLDGYYLKQPTYGLMTHFAKLNNFILCGYDATSSICDQKNITKQQCRDSTQAANISKIFKKNEKAKIIVFGGHAHINKTNNKNFTPMGFYLQKMLPEKKIISINQVSLISSYGVENSMQKKIVDSLKINEPLLIKSILHFDKIKDNTYDAYLIHPNENPIEYWYYSKNKVNTEKISLNPPKKAFYVEIIPTSQFNKNICVFKSLISDLNKKYIYLPKSNYKISYYNDNYELIYDLQINKL